MGLEVLDGMVDANNRWIKEFVWKGRGGKGKGRTGDKKETGTWKKMAGGGGSWAAALALVLAGWRSGCGLQALQALQAVCRPTVHLQRQVPIPRSQAKNHPIAAGRPIALLHFPYRYLNDAAAFRAGTFGARPPLVPTPHPQKLPGTLKLDGHLHSCTGGLRLNEG